MDILTYINKMNRLYGSEPLAPWDKPEVPWWEEKHEPAPWDEAKAPVRYNTRQYLTGGRVQMKPGGLVEPGVTHYGDDLPMNIYKTHPNRFAVRIKRGLQGEKTLTKTFTFGSGPALWGKNYKSEEAALKAAKDFLKKNKKTPDTGIEPGSRGAPLKMEEVKNAIEGYNLKKSDGTFKDWKDLTQDEARKIRMNLKSHDGKYVKPFSEPFKDMKPLPDKIKKALEANFPEVDFKFNKPYKLGFNPRKEPELNNQVRLFVDDYKFGQFPYGDTAEENLWRSLYRSSRKEGGRWQLYSRKPKNWRTNNNWRKATFKDTKTGDLIKLNDSIENPNAKSLKNYLGQKTYDKALLPFKNRKEVLNQKIKYKGQEVKVGKFLKDQFIERKTIEKYGVNYKPADKTKIFKKYQLWSAINVNHPYGVKDNWWTGEVTTRTANMRLQDLTKTLNATTDEVTRKKLIKTISKLPGGAQYFEQGLELGKEPKLTRVVEAAFKEQGAGRTLKANPQLKKFITDNLDDFCTQKVASGGRIGFAGTCTPEQILDNMKKDQQLLLEYKKGTADISEAQAARIAEKFRNASGKVLKLGARGAKFMFGPALLWGEPLFEGAFVAHDMIGNKTPFAEALSKTYFAAPLKWAGILKEPEEYEAEALYRKRGDPGVEVIGARGMKRLERDKPDIIPGVKAYTDARSKLMKINDLRSQISNMEKEVESGVTLGAADALSSLKKQLSKEMSGIRYDEKSLHNIMKKNEQQYNIAVELQRAERFKDVDPVKAQRKTFTEIGGGRDPRYEEMADVNLGRAQQEGVFGHYVSPEKYEQIKNLASQSGEGQGLWQMFKKQIDDMGGPGFGPYKKMLAQGMEGPANRYTWGQVTTPAERYHLDRLGKLAELGGFSFEKAFGGRVPFGKGGMSRRRFLELIGGLAGGAVAFKTGLLKIMKGSTGKTVIKAGDHIIQGTPGMPDWFIPLINRITKEGDDVTKKLGTIERETVHTKKLGKGEFADEVTVYQDMNTGNVRVEYGPPVMDKKGNIIRASNDQEVVHLEYKAPEEITSGKHRGEKTKSEFSAAESEPEVVNWDGDIEFSGINEVNKVDDLVTPTHKLKEFAIKKKPTMKEIVESQKKQKYKSKLETDTMEQIDYIEKKRGPFEEPRSIDDILEEGKAAGEFDPKGYDTHNLWKGQNLPKEYNEKVIKESLKKTKKASGGRVDYDNYLPDIEDIE